MKCLNCGDHCDNWCPDCRDNCDLCTCNNQPERSKREDQQNEPIKTYYRIDGVYEKLDAVL
jgi:hypothetical protein